MDIELLKSAGKIASIGGVALVVFLLVYKDVIRKDVFSRLTKQHSYQLFRLIVIITGIIALSGIIAWVYVNKKEQALASPTPTPTITPKPITSPPLISTPQSQSTPLGRLIPPGFKTPLPVSPSTDLVGVVIHVIDATNQDATIQSSPLVDAKITIRNLQTNKEIEAQSNDNGMLERMLRTGEYLVTATKHRYFNESYTYTTSVASASKPWVIKMRRNWEDDGRTTGTMYINVYDETGNGIPSMPIIVKKQAPPAYAPLNDATNFQGICKLDDVPFGKYVVTIQHDKYYNKDASCELNKANGSCIVSVTLRKRAQ